MSVPVRLQSLRGQLSSLSTRSRSAALSTQRSNKQFTSPPPRVLLRQSRQTPHISSSIPARHFTSSATTANNTTTASSPSAIPDAPNTTTYYTIFPQTLPAGPPPASPFEIHLSTLRREFLQLQNKLHPDKYPPGPGKQAAEALSARINEAYRTLLDPLTRAQYILREFHGIDVTAEDGANQHPLDPELLMEVMEVQETIEEVSGDADAEAKIAELKRENNERVLECVRVLGERFDAGDIEGARGECVRLKFWSGVAGALREWEPGMSQIRLVH